MKTKLTALLLLVVMAVSVLAGCAYDYQKKDLSAYATVDADALYAALQTLVVEDADFTSDPEIRKEKVLRQFAQAIANAIKDDEDRKKTEGAIVSGDYVTYLYHCVVADNEGVNHTTSTGYMVNGKGVSLLLSGNEGLSLQIEKALTGLEVSKFVQETTTGNLPATGLAVVTYTYSTSENGTEKKVNNVLLDLSDTENDLVKALLNRNATTAITVGTEFATGKGDTDKKLEIPSVDGSVITTYSAITVHSVIAGDPVTTWDNEGVATPIVDSPYIDKTAEELLDVTLTDMHGNKISVSKSTTFQYKLYPVSCVGIPDLSEANESGAVQEILFSLLADKIAINDFKVFKSEEYKTADETPKTVASVIAALVADTAAATKAETAKDTAQTAVDKAQTAFDQAKAALEALAPDADKTVAQKKYDEANTALTEAKEALEDATETYDTAAAKIDPATIMATLTACVNADGETAVSAIYDEYYDGLYDTLENSYNNSMINKVYEAVAELFFEHVSYTGELPAAAVKEAFKRNMNAYEYNYHEGTDEASKKPYDEQYATYELFLCAMAKAYNGAEVTTRKEAEAVLRKEAEEQVKEALVIYVIADAIEAKYEDADLTLKKDAAKNYAEVQAYLYNQQILNYYTQLFGSAASSYDFSSMYVTGDYYLTIYGETNLRTAYLADLVMAFMTETKKASDAEDFGGADAIDFKNIAYTIKADAAEGEE